jgi:hypothetical protein
MPSSEYYLKQAQTTARLALAEPDQTKAAKLVLLALEHFDKAKAAKGPNRTEKKVAHQINEP